MKNKVTEELKNLMKDMKSKGFSNKVIAKTLLLAESTVQYHLDEEQRAKQIARAKKNEKKRDRKEYQKNYQAERYNNDPEFREKVKKDNKENMRRKRNGKK